MSLVVLKCPNCGALLENGEKVCRHCNAHLMQSEKDNSKDITNTTKKKNRFFNTYNIVVIAIMTALSLVLSEFPKIPIFFLDVDFSDVPIIFSAFYIHPLTAVLIALVKNLVGLTTSTTMFVGELSNFLLSCLYSLTASCMFMKSRNKPKTVVSSLIAILAVTVGAMFSNYFMMLPLYINLYGLGALQGLSKSAFIFTVILPFNLAKFGLQTGVFLALYFSLYKVLYRLKPAYLKEQNIEKKDKTCSAQSNIKV